MTNFKVGNTVVTECPLVTLDKAVFDKLVAALRLVVSEAVPVGDMAYSSIEQSVINRARAALAKVQE